MWKILLHRGVSSGWLKQEQLRYSSSSLWSQQNIDDVFAILQRQYCKGKDKRMSFCLLVKTKPQTVQLCKQNNLSLQRSKQNTKLSKKCDLDHPKLCTEKAASGLKSSHATCITNCTCHCRIPFQLLITGILDFINCHLAGLASKLCTFSFKHSKF